MKQQKPKSSIIYSGPSLIDGKPIVCIAIVGSDNIKTGNMVQTYIIRSDISPMNASKSGEDFSICGQCIHRGIPTDNPDRKQAENRTCYVTLYQGPTVVYKGYKRGIYPIASVEDTRAIGRGRMVRLGSYGDPSAVPSRVWDALLSESVGHTGYTHQNFRHSSNYTSPDYDRLMYSADSKPDAMYAHFRGLRTFRIIPVNVYKAEGKSAMLPNEILCPASNEAGNKVTCIDCKLCVGSNIKAKSIAIVSHGTNKNKVM